MRDLRSDFEAGFHPSSVELVEIAKYAAEKALSRSARLWRRRNI